MQRRSFLLPALSMGLLYFSLYLGMIVINLRGDLRGGRVDVGVFFHYISVAVSGVGLYGLLRWKSRPVGAAVVFLIALALGSLAIPFLPAEILRPISNGRPPVVALIQAIFLPCALYTFARLAPKGQEAFAFAALLAACELAWTMLFPLFSFISPAPMGQEATYIFSLDCWTVGVGGLCFAASVFANRKQPELAAPGRGACRADGRLALGLIFMAYAGILVLIGMYVGQYMLKMTRSSELIDIPYFAFIFFLPWIGKLLDTFPEKFVFMLIFIFPIMFLLILINHYTAISPRPLYFFLHISQNILNVAAFAAAAKMFKNRPALVIFIVLVYVFLPVQGLGVSLRNAVSSPFVFTFVATGLLAACALCLWGLRGLLAKSPALSGAAQEGAAPANEAADLADFHKLSAFAAAHTLTARERDVLLALIRGDSREDMGRDLSLTPRTVRHHLSNLMKKANMPNPNTLIDYYKAWKQ